MARHRHKNLNYANCVIIKVRLSYHGNRQTTIFLNLNKKTKTKNQRKARNSVDSEDIECMSSYISNEVSYFVSSEFQWLSLS